MHRTPILERTIQAPTATSNEEVYYPESDGKPLGETDFHVSVIAYLRAALRLFFRQAADVYVAANNLLYYEEGNPALFVSPDVYVVRGVSKQDRRKYKLWEEAAAPCVIFEITSRSTRREDLGDKRALYEMLGVSEYFLFDPQAEYLKPQLQGFRLLEDFYTPIPHEAGGAVHSNELGLLLRPEQNLLRLIDLETGQALPTLDEAIERAQAEAQRADNAEAELARVRAELENLQRRSSGSPGQS
jgi:Uma2 family endonuclease